MCLLCLGVVLHVLLFSFSFVVFFQSFSILFTCFNPSALLTLLVGNNTFAGSHIQCETSLLLITITNTVYTTGQVLVPGHGRFISCEILFSLSKPFSTTSCVV
eukprot:TRINITY_DN439_c0_g1_i11.p1 TRINITY_DN439_c0_g1~~TRINITY_DN439_c0_g1_i11.p1  ORF type:complete len:103 (+),score=4.08 TRINITY_DN439_c0_g1_i11:439-747(+)